MSAATAQGRLRLARVWQAMPALAPMLLGAAACDTVAVPGEPPLAMSARVLQSKDAARNKVEAVVKAAEAATATCVAGELIWEADPSGYVIPRHFSRPCLPEKCAPTPQALAALTAATAELNTLVESDVALQVPSYRGVVALAEAMASFMDTAFAGLEKAKAAAAVVKKDQGIRSSALYAANPLADKSNVLKRDVSPLSGLSLHYAAIAGAYNDIYTDAKAPLEPPSLTKSLASDQPGGDPCKGWALPQYCDVRAVRISPERHWRTDPACIEVESVPK